MSDDAQTPNSPGPVAPLSPEAAPKSELDSILKRLEELETMPKLSERTLEWSKLGVTTALALATVMVGLWQYVSTSSFSARQPFLAKQTELCLQAAENTGRLASTIDQEQWKKAKEQFLILYLGPLAIVEEAGTQSQVAQKMIDFRNALNSLGATPSLPATSLETPSLDVAHACRDLLSSKWRAGIFKWVGYE